MRNCISAQGRLIPKTSWQVDCFLYTDFMFKTLNVGAVFLFFLVAMASTYVSAKGAAFAFAQNPEERTFSNSNFEEELHHSKMPVFIHTTISMHFSSFPSHIGLIAKKIIIDVLKPPLAQAFILFFSF